MSSFLKKEDYEQIYQQKYQKYKRTMIDNKIYSSPAATFLSYIKYNQGNQRNQKNQKKQVTEIKVVEKPLKRQPSFVNFFGS